MKQYSRSVILLSVLILPLCILPQLAKAQPGSDPVLYDVDTPIDGGVGILVAAGVAYGIKKIRDERKKTLNKLS